MEGMEGRLVGAIAIRNKPNQKREHRSTSQMKREYLDLFLLLVALLGGILACQTGRQRGGLRAEHERLARITGDLPVADASKVHVRALETGERLHFAWRVYLPSNYQQTLWASSGNESSLWRRDSYESIARVRFRETEQGVLQVYSKFSGVSGCAQLGDRSLAELLHNHWDKIHVEQLGAQGVVAIEQAQSVPFLRLSLPEELQRAAREKLAPAIQERFVPILFELHLGPKAAKP
jgi:hypothetical protein